MRKGRNEVPVVCIVGAGRSGTNFLAHALTADPRFRNLLENRYIWNFRQKNIRTDRRAPLEATSEVKDFIRQWFASQQEHAGQVLIDKTPGNALRLDFVREVLPSAKVINIIRDGRASVYSRKMMWDGEAKTAGKGGAGLGRHLQKFRRMRAGGRLPARRLPVFFFDNVFHYLGGYLFGRPILAGERVPGLREVAKMEGVLVARAFQWRETVMAAVQDGRRIGPEHYLEVRLEALLSEPEAVIGQIFDFLGMEPNPDVAAYIAKRHDPTRKTRWLEGLDPKTRQRLEAMLEPELRFLGYSGSTETQEAVTAG